MQDSNEDDRASDDLDAYPIIPNANSIERFVAVEFRQAWYIRQLRGPFDLVNYPLQLATDLLATNAFEVTKKGGFVSGLHVAWRLCF